MFKILHIPTLKPLKTLKSFRYSAGYVMKFDTEKAAQDYLNNKDQLYLYMNSYGIILNDFGVGQAWEDAGDIWLYSYEFMVVEDV